MNETKEGNWVMNGVNELKALRLKWEAHINDLIKTNGDTAHGGERTHLPVVFKFTEAIQTNFMAEPKQEINASCWIQTYTNNKPPQPAFSLKAGDDTFFYLLAFPLAKLSSIDLHPSFVNIPEPTSPLFKSEEEFEKHLLELINGSHGRVEIAFEFSHPVFLDAWSMVSLDTYFLHCSVQSLKERHELDYRNRVCIHQKKTGKTFYWPKYLPFKHLVSVAPISEYDVPFKVSTGSRKTAIKKRQIKPFEYEPGVKTWDELDISNLLAHPKRERTDHNCILCARETPSPNNFVLLLSNGFVVSEKDYPFKENIIGFKPIGTECMKKLGHDFIFHKSAVEKTEHGKKAMAIYDEAANATATQDGDEHLLPALPSSDPQVTTA